MIPTIPAAGANSYMDEFKFEVIKRDDNSRARVGTIHTRRGDIDTPHFVPVGTLASVRALDSADLESLGAQCALVNTYHLHLKPGDKLVKELGGTHKFMNFNKPLFSDSGGFQAFSLGLAREHNIGKIGVFPEEVENGKLIGNSKRVRPFLKGSDPFEAFLITGVAGGCFAGNGSAVKSVCFSALKSPVIHSGARGVFRV